jgi:hypothetical protein
MAATKYGKYILTEPHAQWTSIEPRRAGGEERSIRINSNLISTISCDCAFMGVSEPSRESEMGHPSHAHDVDEFIFFIGGDPTNLMDFQAEVELTMGEGKDQEKHTINRTSVVYLPKGLYHLPMTYKRVDKPILFGHLLLAPTYSEIRR